MALEEGKETPKEDNKNLKPQNKVVETEEQKTIKKLQEELAALKAKADKEHTVIYGGLSAADLDKVLSKFVKEEDTGKSITADKLDPDDYLVDPVKFYAPACRFVIVEDFKQNRSIKLPGNKDAIIFDHVAMKSIPDGKGMRQHNISRYFSRSKKEVEFLRKHWQYGVYFYESGTTALSKDGLRLMKENRVLSELSNYDAIKLFGLSKQYNVAMNDDIHVLRVNLVKAMVDAEIEREAKQYSGNIISATDSHKKEYNEILAEGK